MALKQGSARETARKKASNRSPEPGGGRGSSNSPGKRPGPAAAGRKKESRMSAPPVNREPRGTTNRDMARAGEKGAGGSLSPQRGKRRLASPPPAGRAKGMDTHARRRDDIEMSPDEDNNIS